MEELVGSWYKGFSRNEGRLDAMTAVELPADVVGMLLKTVSAVDESSCNFGGVEDLFCLSNDGKARSIKRHWRS